VAGVARRTCCVRVLATDGNGTIYLQDGEVVNVTFEDLSGFDAFVALVAASAGHFQVENGAAPEQRNLQGNVQKLLLEANGRIEHGQVPKATRRLAPVPGQGASPEPARLAGRGVWIAAAVALLLLGAVGWLAFARHDVAVRSGSDGAILKKVAQERGAVSYVGIGWVTPDVKVVGVAPRAGQPAVRASVATVRTGTYPIYRPLLMYSRGEPQGEARNLLAFVLSSEGQKLVAKNDFVPTDTPTPLPAASAAAAPAGADRGAGAGATAGAAAASNAPKVLRVQFPGGTELTSAAKATLSGLAESLPPEGSRLLVVGHADVRGSRAVNARVSLARAKAVARYLEQLGVPASAIQVEAHGSDEPIGTNTSGVGRGANRRVDVTVLPARAATAR
jgi:outer membrane protein OmpA-like peptidoglycan-associated protein